MMISSEVSPQETTTSLIVHSPLKRRPGKLQQGLAVTAAGISIIAVFAVPFLVMRSVFFLATRAENFTFEEMVNDNEVVFWIFGPSTALLATIAIAPFNMYNAYKTVINIQLTKKAFKYPALLRMLSGIFLTFSGAVNGYNTNFTIDDIWPRDSLAKSVLKYPIVSIGVLFAGVSDARVFLDYLIKDLTKDWRYLKRGSRIAYDIAKKRLPFFHNYQKIPLPHKITRKDLLQQIRVNLDDLRTIILLALTDTEINQLKELHEDRSWMHDINSPDAQRYLQLFSKQFPMGRFFGSEIFGSTISGLWAYYGNKNTYEYTFKAVSSFLIYCGLRAENLFLLFTSSITSVMAYITGFFVSFFLIRDLFFRDIFKATTWAEFKQRLPKLLIPLIPALSFGLLNVILSVLNNSLSPLEKVIVSCSAIIGATVVTRYGIEGGIEQIRNRPNVRRELANITDELMIQFSSLGFEELQQINDKIAQIKNSLNEMAKRDNVEYLQIENKNDVIGLNSKDSITVTSSSHDSKHSEEDENYAVDENLHLTQNF